MRSVLAIDPGGKHVGMAWFDWEEGRGWHCERAWELEPAVAIKAVRTYLDEKELQALVIEEFRLYPWMSETQAWSDLPTVQLIGVLKYLWAEHGDDQVRLVMQQAAIKKPTRAILRARKIVSEAKRLKAGGHAADAELHGHHFISNTLTKEQETK